MTDKKKKRSWIMWATIDKANCCTWAFPTRELAIKYCNEIEVIKKVKVTEL